MCAGKAVALTLVSLHRYYFCYGGLQYSDVAVKGHISQPLFVKSKRSAHNRVSNLTRSKDHPEREQKGQSVD